MPSWLTASLGAVNSMGRGITALPKKYNPYDDPLNTYGSDTNGYTGQGALNETLDTGMDQNANSPLPRLRPIGQPTTSLPPPVTRPDYSQNDYQDTTQDPGQNFIQPEQPVPEQPAQQYAQQSIMPARPGGMPAQPSAPSSLPPPDPYIQQLRQQVLQEPDLPKAPGTLRSILATIAGATAGGAAFAPLIAYGPKGVAQIGAYQRAQAQLPTRLRIEELASVDANRRDQALDRDTARKGVEYGKAVTAYNNSMKEIEANEGEEYNGTDTLEPGWIQRKVKDPDTNEMRSYKIPPLDVRNRRKQQALHENDIPVPPDIKAAINGLPDKMSVKDVIDIYKEMHDPAGKKIPGPADNELEMISRGAYNENPWHLSKETAADILKTKDKGEPMYPVVQGNQVVYLPRSEARGQSAPRTMYDLATGLPSTGGREGVSMTPPQGAPASSQQRISGFAVALKQANDINDLLAKDPGTMFGPVAGRTTLAEIDLLGGRGASDAEVDMAIRLRRFLGSQAFADGGKALTSTELGIFKDISPLPTDLLPAAIRKTKNAIQFLKDRGKFDLLSMTPIQRALIAPEFKTAFDFTDDTPSTAAPGSRRQRTSKVTKKTQHSLDGGVTWLDGPLPPK